MDHRSLTAEYLANYGNTGPSAAEMADTVRTGVQATSYGTRALSRPVFLGHAEHQQLAADLGNIHDAIAAIPNRVFGGDLRGFCDAVGMPPVQAAAVLRSHGSAPVRLSRADLCMDRTGFRLLEVNMGSTMAGFDNGFLNESMLQQPYLRSFVAEHGLSYLDSVAELANTILTECKVPSGVRPVVAIVDWPESFRTLEPQLHKSAALLARHGLEPLPCHIGQLSFADGAVWLGERRIDILYRLFTMSDLLEDSGPGLIEPVLSAVERGEVQIFTPMETYLYGSKGALAILSEETHRPLLSDAQRDSVDRLLPWTRMVRPGPVTVDGRQVELVRYAIERQSELILKPTLLYGGLGVLPGWLTTAQEWREQLDAAMGKPYVLQRRIEPVVELFPAEDGLEPWTLVWAHFTMTRGAGGLYIRGGRGRTAGVVNIAQGAAGTCCFVETG